MAKSKYKLKVKKRYLPLVFNLHDILGIAAIIWALSFIFSFGTDYGVSVKVDKEKFRFRGCGNNARLENAQKIVHPRQL